MPLINITDKEGNVLPAREVGNVRFPTFYPEDVLQHIPELKLRDDDILITNWMRSGTHWLFEMVCMLLNNDTATIRKEKRENALEYQPISVLNKLPSRRVFNTHLLFRYLPEDLKTKRCKVIYLLRNPRDAMVSWFRLHKVRPRYTYKGTFDTWFPLCLNGELHWGGWFDHVRDWEKAFEDHQNLDVHFWFYEDMKTNPLEELRKVSEFLGTDTKESLLEAIIDKCRIEKMREDKRRFDKLNDVDTNYGTGNIGDWKKMFTVEQYEEFEKTYRKKMAGSRFYTRYKGPVELL